MNMKWSYLAALICISAFLVFYQFNAIPRNLAFDEIESTRLALHLHHEPLTVYSPLATGHATPYYYIILGFFTLLGVNSLALRLPSALFGILSVVVFYRIIYAIYKRDNIAFLYAMLFVTMRWYFNFARFSFEGTFLILLELTSILCMLKDWKSSHKYYAVGSAIFAGLAFYSYLPGRIFFLVPLLCTWLFQRKKLTMYLLTIGLLITPMLAYYTHHSDVRINQVSVINNNRYTSLQKLSTIGQNIVRFGGMFINNGDMNGRHNFPGKPAVNPIMTILISIGLLSFYKKWTKYSLLFLIYAIIGAIPTLLTPLNDNPNMLRTITVTPAAAYFMGSGVQTLSELSLPVKKRLISSMLAILIIISVAYELRTYFMFQSRVFKNAFEVTCDLHTLSRWDYSYIPNQCRVHKNEF